MEENKEYEIWVGYYHFGTGHDGSDNPEMVSVVIAPNFKVACYLYELRSSLKSIEDRVLSGEYIDHQSCRWFYNFNDNTNSWTGKYFESKESAQESFKKTH